MKTLKFREKALRVLFVGLLLCLSLLILPVASGVRAATDYTPDDNGIAKAGFYMNEGARVRLPRNTDTKQGISFGTNVEEGFYNYLTETYSGATITFHTLINYDGKAVEEITPANTTQDITLSTTPSFNGDSTFVYNASIIYNGDSSNGVSEETKRAAYSVELTARAYVLVDVVDGEDQIIYAKCGDTERSMKGVASAAYLSAEDDAKEILANYMIEEDDSITDSTSELNGYYGETYVGGETYDKDAYEKQGLISIPQTKIVEAYLGARKLDLTEKEDGSAVISGYEFDETSITKNGEDVLVTAYDEDGNAYFLTCKLATRVLTVAEDFSIFTYAENENTEFSGYYVLGNDIDASQYTHTGYENFASGTDTGLTGTFDGNGYTVSGLNILDTCSEAGAPAGDTRAESLFGKITGGTVKNVAFKGVTVFGRNSSLFGGVWDYSVIENVYISASNVTGKNASPFMNYQIIPEYPSRVTNVIIEMPTYTKDSWYGSLVGSNLTLNTNAGEIELNGVSSNWSWSNVYVISKCELSGFTTTPIDAENRGGTVKNVYRYDTIDDMKAANNDYSAFTGVWKIGADKIPVWHDTKEVKELATTYNYSQMDKALIIEQTDDIYGYTEIVSETSGYTATLSADGLVIAKDGAADFTAKGETIVLSATKGDTIYKFSTKVYTKAIDEASDFTIFSTNVPASGLNGYYALTKNIDASNYTHAAVTATSELTGTFDGNGYTVTGLKIIDACSGGATTGDESTESLFGKITGGTVKNVAFKEITVFGRFSSLFGTLYSRSVIENVYISASNVSGKNASPFLGGNSGDASRVTNVIIEMPTYTKDSWYGSLVGSQVTPNTNAGEAVVNGVSSNWSWSNVYVISTCELSGFTTTPIDAENRGGTVKNVERYYTDADLKEAILAAENKDARLAAFDNGYWNVDYTTGAITFKTK